MTATEVRSRWRGIKFPDNFMGYFNEEAGVMKVRAALDSFRDIAIKKGAKLFYNSEVKNVNTKEGYIDVDN